MVSVRYLNFTETVKSVSVSAISENMSEEGLCRLMRRLFSITDEILALEIPNGEKEKTECRKGCSFCCRVTVPVLLPEAAIIASYLKEELSRAALDTLMKKMRRFVIEISGYDETERIAANKKCVFLDSTGGCFIHMVRPFVCRSIISADASACREAMRINLFEEQVLVPINIKHKSINDSAFIGLSEALKASGLDDRSREITSAVLDYLEK